MTDFVARYVTVTDPLRAYDRVVEAVGRLVANMSDDQIERPSPCAEWTVRDVLDHLVEILDMYGALASHGVPLVEGERRMYDDPLAAFPAMAASTRAAFATPAFLDTVADTPIGPQPGRVVVQHVINELTAHGWDLARATGQGTDLVPDIAEAVLASWRAFFDGWDRAQLSYNFHHERPQRPDDPAADRLAAYLGRAM